MRTITEELLDNVLDTNFGDFSDEIKEDVKNNIIDIVSVTIGGANASGNLAILDLLRKWGGSKEATILAHGDKVPLHNAALMNSIMARSYDYEVLPDAALKTSGGHLNSVLGPTAITVAEHKGSSGKELICALALGSDLAVRISAAGDFDIEKSLDPTGTAAAFGAAAITGKLWGLNETQMMNAWGILVNQVGGSLRCILDGAHAFKLYGAFAASNAIVAVQLASKGITGMKDPLLCSQGFFPTYYNSYQPEVLTKDLGKVFYSKSQHKKYPSCFGNHMVLHCGFEIVQQHDINAEDITEVILGVAKGQIGSPLDKPFRTDSSQTNSLFNLRYAAASVLLKKDVKLINYTDGVIHDPKIVEFTNKIRLVESDRPVEMTVKMKDGKNYLASCSAPPLLLTREEIKGKFWDNFEFSNTVSRKNAEKALSMLENLEEIDNVSEIIKLLIASKVGKKSSD